jgi:hypothetical protein
MLKSKFLIPILFLAGILSCKKEHDHPKLTEKTSVNTLPRVDSFPDSLVLNQFDSGCMVSYSKKGSDGNENIFMLGPGVPAEMGRSLIIMKIDGTWQRFRSNDERDIHTINNNLIKANFNNKDYQVEVITHFGPSSEASDSTEHSGTIKIIRKKDHSKVSVGFIGGLAC